MTMSDEGSDISHTARHWSLHNRLVVPALLPDYYDRPALVEQLISDHQPITILRAPGGFGKTTLLAAYCQRLSERDHHVAWVQMDRTDTRSSIEDNITLAFRHAGVDVPKPESDAWRTTDDRIKLLLSVVATHHKPCALVLDNLEQLTERDSGTALMTLLRMAPPNLCVALAYRALSISIDIAESFLAGRVVMLTAAELRFSPQETAAFLGKGLSRMELSAIDRQFEGWPIAVALHRKFSNRDTPGRSDSDNLFDDWIESRLLEYMATDQREFLFDAGLCGSLDPVLLDEVLDRNDSRYRLQAMHEFDGLIRPLPGNGAGIVLLHPRLRQYCKERRLRETPERFQTIHHRAALALDRRGETLAAISQAAEAGNPELLGRLIEDAGGLRMWIHLPPQRLDKNVFSFLTSDVINQWPRLALAKCFAAMFNGHMAEAYHLYETAAASSDGFTHNPTGDDRDLRIDQFIMDMSFFIIGCSPMDSAEFQSAVANILIFTQDENLDPVTRAILNFGLCIYENRRARFDASLERIEQVRQLVRDGQSLTISILLDMQLGTMSMAQGYTHEAEAHYVSALRAIQACYPYEPMPEVSADALFRELQYERNRLTLATAAGMPLRDNFTGAGHTLVTHVSDARIILDIAQHTGGDNEAHTVLNEMIEYARATKRPSLIRCLSALRVATYARAGRVEQAQRAWRAAALPSDNEGCLNLQVMYWREMEMISCARLDLYAACEAFGAGREFAGQILRVAKDYNLVHTTMYVYALLMTLEWRAGDMDAACAHLKSFLQHYATTDYARPIIREADIGCEVLEYLLASHPEDSILSAVGDLLKLLGRNDEQNAIVRFSDREMAVLKLLPNLRDKQIADQLSMSRDGVRYHLRRIFVKLEVNDRNEAVRTARAIGLLPL